MLNLTLKKYMFYIISILEIFAGWKSMHQVNSMASNLGFQTEYIINPLMYVISPYKGLIQSVFNFILSPLGVLCKRPICQRPLYFLLSRWQSGPFLTATSDQAHLLKRKSSKEELSILIRSVLVLGNFHHLPKKIIIQPIYLQITQTAYQIKPC